MTDKSEWQELNRRLMAERRRELGEPPTAAEMLAYSRGEMTEVEEERIRELLVAYPELARGYGAAFIDESPTANPGVPPDEKTLQSWSDLQRRLGVEPMRREGMRFRHYVPTSIAAALALVFFGLYVQAEGRARQFERQPVVLGLPQDLEPGGTRGSSSSIPLNNKDGEAYLLKPSLINQPRYPSYQVALYDGNRLMWLSHNAQMDGEDKFQIVIPHEFLRASEHYQLRISGVDGQNATLLASFNLVAPAE